MNYTQDDLNYFKELGINSKDIDQQLSNFKTGFKAISLVEPATINNGIISIQPEEEDELIATYDNARTERKVMKMVPASGSATRMFKDLFAFMDTYTGSSEDFLNFVQYKDSGTMYYFFQKLDEMPFYERLSDTMWKAGKDIKKEIEKRNFGEILKFILYKKGLNYSNTPKGLVDFHIYRDFVRTAFDEHLVEGATYANDNKVAHIHFTVSEEYLHLFQARLRKVSKVFEKMFGIKYEVTFSIQNPTTDMVCLDMDGNIVRDENNKIVFRPGGHGALIHNLNELDADIIFIKNIDNVLPDRAKADTIKYKKMLAGFLIDVQQKVFDFLNTLDNDPDESQLAEIESYLCSIGYKETENLAKASKAERISYLQNLLDRPIRICGMVKNEGEPGGGPFWVKTSDGNSHLMIVETSQIDTQDKTQKEILANSTHFNPVDIVCSIKNRNGEKYDLTKFIAKEQGFISTKSYKGQEIKIQELPGLWNGAMANWTTVFVEVPLTTFTPVKTVFDLFRFEHRNILKR